MRRADRGVRNIAENTSVDRTHRVRVPRHICDDFDCRAAVAGVNEIEPQRSGRWRIVEPRIELHIGFRRVDLGSFHKMLLETPHSSVSTPSAFPVSDYGYFRRSSWLSEPSSMQSDWFISPVQPSSCRF